MAWAKGTATDFIDLLRLLRQFARGVDNPTAGAPYSAGSGVVPGGEAWTVLTNGGSQPTIPASGNATDGEVYLRGPGGGSDTIFVQVKTYRDAPTSRFNWEIRGATNFSSVLAFDAQAAVSPPNYLALANASINFHFYVNGRRIIMVAQRGTTYEATYLGFVNPYGTAAQWGYPLLVTGSVRNSTDDISLNTFLHSSMPDAAFAAAHLRWVDGSWVDVSNYTAGAGVNRINGGDRGMWPYQSPIIRDASPLAANAVTQENEYSEESIFQGFNASSVRLGTSFTGRYQLHPVNIIFDESVILANLVGALDSVFAVYGLGLATGDTFTVGADTYDVFSNTWRSELVDYYAIRRA